MSRFPQFLAAVAAAVLVVPGGALAGTLTLHPAGFGAMSYSSWKAHQGLKDDLGNDDQALYFQKQTTTATAAAGVAVIKGIAGTPLGELTGLAWDHRLDGHCGAGAPRWNVSLQDGMGHNYTVFLGCQTAAHAIEPAAQGWCQDVYSGQGIIDQAAAQTGLAPGDAAGLTIRGLAIVFDEGNDQPNAPAGDCVPTNLAGGYVYLDNIAVQANGVGYCWTSANDNGSANNAANCPALPGGVFQLSVPAMPLGLAVDPTDTALVDALNLAVPGVPLTSWLLYPSVIA